MYTFQNQIKMLEGLGGGLGGRPHSNHEASGSSGPPAYPRSDESVGMRYHIGRSTLDQNFAEYQLRSISEHYPLRQNTIIVHCGIPNLPAS